MFETAAFIALNDLNVKHDHSAETRKYLREAAARFAVRPNAVLTAEQIFYRWHILNMCK